MDWEEAGGGGVVGVGGHQQREQAIIHCVRAKISADAASHWPARSSVPGQGGDGSLLGAAPWGAARSPALISWLRT